MIEKLSKVKNIKSIKKYLFVTLLDVINTNNFKNTVKSKSKIKDDRMTLAERKAFIEQKIKQNISFKPPED